MAKPPTRTGQPAIAQLSLQARRLVADVAANFYELGRVLGKIQEEHRYREAGHANFVDYVDEELDLTPATAYKFINVYRHYSATVARRYGVSKLEAGLAYLRATPADEQPGDLISATLQIQGGRGFVPKNFHDATVRQIREATAVKLGQKRARQTPVRVSKSAARLGKNLPPAPARLVRGDRIRMQRDPKTGEYYATFTAIPMGNLDELMEFLKTFREKMGV